MRQRLIMQRNRNRSELPSRARVMHSCTLKTILRAKKLDIEQRCELIVLFAFSHNM